MNNQAIISKKLLKFLKFCFWYNILLLIGSFLLGISMVSWSLSGNRYEPNLLVIILSIILVLPAYFMFGYSLYFFYKYDKYSKSGIFLFFFNFLYANIYFYNVIWKRKRELVNSYESEPILGNKIFIETEDE